MTVQYHASFTKILKALFPAALCLGLAFFTTPLHAAPLDNAANSKIDESINEHYLAMEFTQAEALLKGTIKACGKRCSKKVLARAYMYIGVVRGAGNGDMSGAQRAFEKAVALNAFIALDRDLATDGLRKVFERAGGDPEAKGQTIFERGAGQAGTGAAPAKPKRRTRPARSSNEIAGPPGTSGKLPPNSPMVCLPDITEVQTLRPIPVSCRSGKRGVRGITVYYKEFGNPSWAQLKLSSNQGVWMGQLPCAATGIQGTLKWYAVATDGTQTPIDSYASEVEPMEIQVVGDTDEAPPSHRGQSPPARCSEATECPEDMRGTPACPGSASGSRSSASPSGNLGWGAACSSSRECSEDLYCINGSCDAAPACETDDECDSGSCEDSLCEMSKDDDDSKDSATSFFSINIGADLSLLSGEGVCNPHPDVGSQYECYLGTSPYSTPSRDPYGPVGDPSLSGNFGFGPVPGTLRATLGYEYVIAGAVGIEGQAGMAFFRAPSATAAEMFHAHLRAKYWMLGTGEGIKPFIAFGGGIGEVNARKTVVTKEYDRADPNGPRDARSEEEVISTLQAERQSAGQDAPTAEEEQQAVDQWRATGGGQWGGDGYEYLCGSIPNAECTLTPVNAWLRLGTGFVTGSLGAMWRTGSLGIVVEVQGKYMLPRSALVLQPTLGLALAF